MTSTIFDTDEPRTIMTYNLKNGSDADHWTRRREALFQVIRQARPLILGTQEGYRYQLDEIAGQLDDYAWLGRARFIEDFDEFNAIFYDRKLLTVSAQGTFWLSGSPDEPGSLIPGEHLPRIATWMRCAIAGHDRGLQVVNTHLTYDERGFAAQTAALIAGIERHTEPSVDTILMGDFNQARGTATWQTLGEIGFVDAWEFARRAEGPTFTFAGWDQWDEQRLAEQPAVNQIDWILYRPGTGLPLPDNTVVTAINTHAGGDAPSDHFPVTLSNR